MKAINLVRTKQQLQATQKLLSALHINGIAYTDRYSVNYSSNFCPDMLGLFSKAELLKFKGQYLDIIRGLKWDINKAETAQIMGAL